MSYKVEPLPNSVADLGEAPHWDIATQNLYYVDIVNGKLLRYDFNENKVYHCKIGELNYSLRKDYSCLLLFFYRERFRCWICGSSRRRTQSVCCWC